jgi:hypothetical protein
MKLARYFLFVLGIMGGGIFRPAQASDFHTAELCQGRACFKHSTSNVGDGLPLLGIGTMNFLIFEVYSAALYGPPGACTSERILDRVPKVLEIHYLRSVAAEDMRRYTEETIRGHPGLNWLSLAPTMDRVNSSYVAVRRGDRYRLEYVPSGPLRLLLNGRLVWEVVDDDFARAYFGIWLSRHSISEDLTEELLQSDPLGRCAPATAG